MERNFVSIARGKQNPKMHNGITYSANPVIGFKDSNLGIGIEVKNSLFIFCNTSNDKPVASLRTMNLIEYLPDFSKEGEILQQCFMLSLHLNQKTQDPEVERNIRNIIGIRQYNEALLVPPSAKQTDYFIKRIAPKVQFEQIEEEIRTEIEHGRLIKTEMVAKYLDKKGNIDPPRPSFEKVMDFNENILPLFRIGFTEGRFNENDAQKFLDLFM